MTNLKAGDTEISINGFVSTKEISIELRDSNSEDYMCLWLSIEDTEKLITTLNTELGRLKEMITLVGGKDNG